MTRHANARDANETEIVDALRCIGASVYRLDVPCDVIVGFRGRNYLIEIKLPPGPKGGTSRSSLTEDQLGFQHSWRGQFAVVRSVDEAFAAICAAPLPQTGREIPSAIFSKDCTQ